MSIAPGKKTRGYVKWLKEHEYTKEYMQSEWDRAVATGLGVVTRLANAGFNWDNLSLSQMEEVPGLAERLIEEHEKIEAEERAAGVKERMKKMDKQYYYGHMEEVLAEKVRAGVPLTESELEDFATQLHAEDEIEGDIGRWDQAITTIIKLNDEFWAIDWQRGLTEYQENYFGDQPRQVRPVEKTIVVREWV